MDLELNIRAFARPFAHIPVGRTKECQECVHSLLQVVLYKVPLTTNVKISLQACFCPPAIKINIIIIIGIKYKN